VSEEAPRGASIVGAGADLVKKAVSGILDRLNSGERLLAADIERELQGFMA